MAPSEELYLYLTTTGWKSGKEHEIEIWFAALDGRYYLIAEKRDRAHWVQNLRREPRVRFRVGGATYPATARVLDDVSEGERTARARALFDEKYGWSAGLLVELEPDRR